MCTRNAFAVLASAQKPRGLSQRRRKPSGSRMLSLSIILFLYLGVYLYSNWHLRLEFIIFLGKRYKDYIGSEVMIRNVSFLDGERFKKTHRKF